MSKRTVVLVAGSALAVGFVVPMAFRFLNVQESDGFGMDDVIAALIIAGTVWALDAAF